MCYCRNKCIEKNPNVSLLVIGFYIYFSGFVMSIIFYNIKYLNYTYHTKVTMNPPEVFPSYFSFHYISNISIRVPYIWWALILSEFFRYVCIMYINKKGYLSKVGLYGSLHGFYVVILYIAVNPTPSADYIFIWSITVAYIWLFSSKVHKNRIGMKILALKSVIMYC